MATQHIVPVAIPTDTTQEVRFRKLIRDLGISETAIGCLCILLGISIMVHYSSGSRTFNNGPTTGEGVYCGVMMLVAGIVGIAVAEHKLNKCLLYCHASFAIVAAGSSGLLFSIGIPWAILSSSTLALILFIIEALLGLTSLVLFAISTTLSFGNIPGCCACLSSPHNTGQVVYLTTNKVQQPETTLEGTQQVFVIQGYQPPPQLVQSPGPSFQPVLFMQPTIPNQPAAHEPSQNPKSVVETLRGEPASIVGSSPIYTSLPNVAE